MPIEDDDDRLEFFDPDEFGEIAKWSKSGPYNPVDLPGMFVSGAEIVAENPEGIGIAGSRALFIVRESDIPGADESDSIKVKAGDFEIATVPEAVEGIVRLVLRKA